MHATQEIQCLVKRNSARLNDLSGEVHFTLPLVDNLYTEDIEIDYRDNEVTSNNILNLFRGRYDPDVLNLL